MRNEKQKDTIRKILSYMKRYRIFLILSVIMAAASVILSLYLPILTGDAVDYIIEAGKVDFAGILPILKKMGIIIILTALAQWIMNICNNKMTYNIVRDIRDDAFHTIEKLPLSYLHAHSHGEVVSRVIADVDQFADGLLMGLTQLFTGIVTMVGTLIFMMMISVKISMVVVLITPLSFVLAGYIAKDIFDVQAAVGGKRKADRDYRRDDWKSEGCEGFFP